VHVPEYGNGQGLVHLFELIAIPFFITHIAKRRAMMVMNKIVPQMIKVITIAVFIFHLLAAQVTAIL
jgi:hypothetical protein